MSCACGVDCTQPTLGPLHISGVIYAHQSHHVRARGYDDVA